MANKLYVAQETTLRWTDSGGDNTMTLNSLASGSIRVGAQDDLGSASRASRYLWQLVIDGFATAPVVGEEVHIYLAYSHDATDIDGDVGASDAAGDVNDLPSLHHIGTVVVGSTTAGDEIITSGQVEILARYVSPVIYNNTADAFAGSATHEFMLIPMPPEVQ